MQGDDTVLRDRAEELFFRVLASSRLFRPFHAQSLPKRVDRLPSNGPLDLEIVSHCWRYEQLLTYQLSSLVLYPPESVNVRMTVFYSDDDCGTRRVLDFFQEEQVPNVEWRFWRESKARLFRRSIGRNLAARATVADWLWFCDCDVTFQKGALDCLVAELRHSNALLAFPREHQVSDVLEPSDKLLRAAAGVPAVLDIDRSRFRPELRRKAVGGFQIVPGDIARSVGYCSEVGVFQRPATRFGSTWEDRTYRWLLGTHGTPLGCSGFYRIRHAAKGRHGRYASSHYPSRIRVSAS